MDVTANCISEIACVALDEFDLYTVHKLRSKEKKSRLSQDLNPGLLGGKQECLHCAMQPLNLWFDTGELVCGSGTLERSWV